VIVESREVEGKNLITCCMNSHDLYAWDVGQSGNDMLKKLYFEECAIF